MNEQERELAAHHLAVSRERLLGLVEGLSAEQWGFPSGARDAGRSATAWNISREWRIG